MAMAVPTFELHNAAAPQTKLPAVSLGCAVGDWAGAKGTPEPTRVDVAPRVFTVAMDAGVRAFDSAHIYRTDPVLGRQLEARFATGELAREDVWVATKVACPNVAPPGVFSPLRSFDWSALQGASFAQVQAAVQKPFWVALDELGLAWADLVLMHFPGPLPKPDGTHVFSPDEARRVRRLVWQVLVELQQQGRARAVGVSNFSPVHLQQLKDDLPEGFPMPAVNQVEVSPYCFDRNLIAACKAHRVVPQAYCPFAAGQFGLLTDPVLVNLAEAKKVTVGQVILHWLWQRGVAAVPKSSSVERLKANQDIASFQLSDSELTAIDALSAEGTEFKRLLPPPQVFL